MNPCIGMKATVGIPGTAVGLAAWPLGRAVGKAIATVGESNLYQFDRNFESCTAASIFKGNRMLRSRYLLTSFLCLAVGVSAALAQAPRVSPPDITSAVVDGNRVSLFYSRPYSKDPKTGEKRKIWGGLIPYGKIWRVGANEATTLITQKPIMIGGQTVPAGAFTLFVLPEEDGKAQLIVNKQIGQWGLQYDEKQDLFRTPLTFEALKEPVDQFAMSVSRVQTGGGVIKLMWESTQYSVPFTVVK